MKSTAGNTLEVHVSTDLPASVRANALLMVSRTMTMGPRSAADRDHAHAAHKNKIILPTRAKKLE